jgi:hypothetical protein
MQLTQKINEDTAALKVNNRCGLSTGSRGRGLFFGMSGFDGGDPRLITVPLEGTVCVAEDPSKAEAKEAIADVYARWEALHGMIPPPAVMGALQGEWNKDLRVAVGLLWASQSVPAWKKYREEWMPTYANLPSLYLATAKELTELQDEQVMGMAKGAQSMMDRAWDTVNASPVMSELAGATKEDFAWAYSMIHTRCFGAEIRPGIGAAFCAPVVDMVNHSFAPNSKYVCDAEAGTFQLKWDTSNPRHPVPVPTAEVLVSYGDRLPNAFLAVKYGFVDPANPNASLPQDVLKPAFARLQEGHVLHALHVYAQGGGDQDRLSAAKNALAPCCGPATMNKATSHEKKTVQAFLSALWDQLDSSPTTIEEDQRLLEQSDLPCRVRTCVEYRLDRKKLVKVCIDVMQIWQQYRKLEAAQSH